MCVGRYDSEKHAVGDIESFETLHSSSPEKEGLYIVIRKPGYKSFPGELIMSTKSVIKPKL